MLRSILVPLDGSAYGDTAVTFAIHWAKLSGASLTGLALVDESEIVGNEAVPAGAAHYKRHRDKVLIEEAHQKATALVADFVARCQRAGVANVKTHVEHGEPFRIIQREAQCHDVIMMGQSADFYFTDPSDFDDDGTIKEVLLHSPRPVITTPSQFAGGSSIVIGYDGSLQSSRALQMFGVLEIGVFVPVHVLCIKDKDNAEADAQRACEFLRVHKINPTLHVLEHEGSVGKIIIDKARELDAGLLVMGAYGKPDSLREWVFGSVTKTILKDANIPLFLYH